MIVIVTMEKRVVVVKEDVRRVIVIATTEKKVAAVKEDVRKVIVIVTMEKKVVAMRMDARRVIVIVTTEKKVAAVKEDVRKVIVIVTTEKKVAAVKEDVRKVIVIAIMEKKVAARMEITNATTEKVVAVVKEDARVVVNVSPIQVKLLLQVYELFTNKYALKWRRSSPSRILRISCSFSSHRLLFFFLLHDPFSTFQSFHTLLLALYWSKVTTSMTTTECLFPSSESDVGRFTGEFICQTFRHNEIGIISRLQH